MKVNKIDLNQQLTLIKKYVEVLEQQYVPFYSKLYETLKEGAKVEEVNDFVSKQWEEWNDACVKLIYARLNLAHLYIDSIRNGTIDPSADYYEPPFFEIIPRLQQDLIDLEDFDKWIYLKKTDEYSFEHMGELESMSHLIFTKMSNHGHDFIIDMEDIIDQFK